MPSGAKLERKNAYMARLVELVESKPMALIVEINNVGSKQMQNIRLATRGKCILLMGKNTMIRTAIRKRIDELETNGENVDGHKNLLENVNGNIGFIFLEDTKYLDEIRNLLIEMRVPAAAKAGVVAPKNVTLPAGPTGLEPSQTSFFQAMNIPTKIVKGAIEVTTDFQICTEGERVALSAQALLTKLGQKPFEYGMKVINVYQDGAVFAAAVLDITDDILRAKFMKGVANVAALGREIGIPTEAGLPHMFCNAFKNIVALVADIDYSFEEVAEIKALLNDPEALAKMQAAAAASASAGGAGGAAPAAAAAAAPVEEEEDDMDFDLFD